MEWIKKEKWSFTPMVVFCMVCQRECAARVEMDTFGSKATTAKNGRVSVEMKGHFVCSFCGSPDVYQVEVVLKGPEMIKPPLKQKD